MKLKIIFRCLGFPFLTAAILFWPTFDRLSLRLFAFLAIGVGILVRYFLNRKKYLTHLAIEKDALYLQYMTAFLQKKELQFHIDDLENLKLSRDQLRYEYAGYLRFKVHGIAYSFPIIQNQLYTAVEKLITAAQPVVAKAI